MQVFFLVVLTCTCVMTIASFSFGSAPFCNLQLWVQIGFCNTPAIRAGIQEPRLSRVVRAFF
jgi:hypothetical protein